MKPELSDFFTAMGAYFAAPNSTRPLHERFPSWDADPARVAIYGRFVEGHIREAVEKNHPLTRSQLAPETWRLLLERYYATRPATHFELNQASASFSSFLEDQVESLQLPPFLPALARFEWTDFEVYVAKDAIPSHVDVLTPNPTLAVLQHPFLLVPWIRAGANRPAAPQPGEETVLMWRHPRTHLCTYLQADARALLVLKLAIEQIPMETAASDGGIDAAQLEQWVSRAAADGLVLVPQRSGSAR